MDWWAIALLALLGVGLAYGAIARFFAWRMIRQVERELAEDDEEFKQERRSFRWMRVRGVVGFFVGGFISITTYLASPMPENIWVFGVALLGGGWLGRWLAALSGWALLLGPVGWIVAIYPAAINFPHPSWGHAAVLAAGLAIGAGAGLYLTSRRFAD